MAVQESSLRVGIDSSAAVAGGRRAQGALRGVANQATMTEQRVRSLGTSFMSLQGAMLGLTAGTGLIMGIRLMASFGQEMATTRAITNATAAQFQNMRDTALELGRTTRFTSTQAAEGLLYLGRAGFTAAEGVEAIPGVLNLAQAGAIDLGSAADIASNILTGFALSVQETDRVVDVMTATVNSSNTNVQQLGDAMKYVAPVAATLGISIEETAAAIGNLSNAGLQGSMAGTGLRGVIARLEAPSRQLQRDLEGMGIRLEEVRPSAVGLTEAIQRLVDAGAQGRGLELFEQRAGPAFEVLARNLQSVRDMRTELDDADGTARRVAGTMDDTLNGSLLRLLSAMQGLIHAIGDQGAEGGLRGVIDGLTSAFGFLSENAGAVSMVLAALTARAMVPLVAMISGPLIGSLGTLSTALQLLTIRGGAAIVMAQGLRTALMLVGGPLGIAVGLISVLAFEFIRASGAARRAQESLEDFREDSDALERNLRRMNRELGVTNPVEDVGQAAETYSPRVRELAREMEGVTEQMVVQAMLRRTEASQNLETQQIQHYQRINELREQEADALERIGRREAMRSGLRGGELTRAQRIDMGVRWARENVDAELDAIQSEIEERTNTIDRLGENMVNIALTPIQQTIERIRAEFATDLDDDGADTGASIAEQRIAGMIENLRNQRAILETEGDLNRAILANLLDAGLSGDSTSTAAQQIRDLTTAIFQLEEAEDAADDAQRGRIDTFEEYMAQIQRNIDLMNLDARERQVRQQAQNIEQALLRSQIELTDTQIEQLHEQIRLEQQLSAVTKERDQILETLRGPVEEYTNRMAALNQTLAMFPEAADLVQREIYETQLAFLEAQVGMGEGTFADAFLVQLARMSEGARNMTQSVGQTFGAFNESLVNGFADSIGRSIVYAEDLGSALQDVARQALAQLISSLVKLGIQYLVNAAIGEAVATAATAASVAQAQIVGAAWANAAAMVSLATFGANAIPAGAGISSVVALAQGLAAFKNGGYTGNGGVNDVVGVVHGKEYVVDAQTTAQYRPLLDAITGRRASAPGSPGGAAVSAGGGDVHHWHFPTTIEGAGKNSKEIVDEMATNLIPKIKQVARDEIKAQKRPGGMLSPG